MKSIVTFNGKLLIIGFGTIGQTVLPLIRRHINISPDRITIISAEDTRSLVEDWETEIRFIQKKVTKQNYREIILEYIGSGDFLLNVASDVSSYDLIQFCQKNGTLYLDTTIETWPEGERSHSEYSLREKFNPLRNTVKKTATALISHGANPGLVSSFVKRALLTLAAHVGDAPNPQSKSEWANLMRLLDIKTIHISEWDTQSSSIPKKRDEFVNTWSVSDFVAEFLLPPDPGWGTHEKELPPNTSKHARGSKVAIRFRQLGHEIQLRSWLPQYGQFIGNLITHNETLSIADYYTVYGSKKKGNRREPVYRPTVCFVYHASDDARSSFRELIEQNLLLHPKQRIMKNEVAGGGAENLGVLLMGNQKGSYWCGSYVTIGLARELLPNTNATALQVAAGVLAGMVWVMENPKKGVLEPDETDHERILEVARPYLGELFIAYTDWAPGRDTLSSALKNSFDNQWQFKDFVV